MNNRRESFTREVISLFRSHPLLLIPLMWHIFQCVFVVLHLRPHISPDEDHHYQVIQLFSKVWSLRIDDSADSMKYGTLSVWPYLYHRILGYVAVVTENLGLPTLFLLRGINVLLSGAFFCCAALLCSKLTRNVLVQLLFLGLLSNIPKLQMLGGAISYDNFINLLSVLLILWTLRLWHNPTVSNGLGVGIILCTGSLAKLTFLPWVLFTTPLVLVRILQRGALHVSFTEGRLKKISLPLVLGFIVSFSLCLDLYLRNLYLYGTPIPSPEQVWGYETAYENYPLFHRDEEWRKQALASAEPMLSPYAWFRRYAYMVSQSTLGIQAHKNYGRRLDHIALYRLVWLPFLVGSLLLLIPAVRRRMFSDELVLSNSLLALAHGVFYFCFIAGENYVGYLSMGMFGVGLQGRYTFPALAPLLSLFSAICLLPYHRFIRPLIVLALVGLFLSLGGIFIVLDSVAWDDLLAPLAVFSAYHGRH